ncbi:MAG: AAA family ATPase, partial [Bradymonadaceae bacterium]
MKFHRIGIENLNSLYGAHAIDFDADLEEAPLYLIMGPTGSGKTTILDAICLALFGTTPRLREISSRAERGAKILSHGRGEAGAQVVFSVIRDGARVYYEATWAFHLAHQKPGGAPQTPSRQLRRREADEEDWELLTNSEVQKEYDPEFDEALGGLELDDFLRSVLLAQGEFAAFLDADEGEKAEILERLTDTDRYKELGRLTADRWREVRDEVERQEEILESRDEVPEEELDELDEAIAELTSEIEELKEAIAADEAKRDWLKKREDLATNLEEAHGELEEAEQRREKHAEAFRELERAERVDPLRDIWRKRREADEEREELDGEIEQLAEIVEQRREELEEAEETKDEAEERRDDRKERLEEMRPAIKEAHGLKKDLQNARQQREAVEEELESRRQELEEAEQTVEEATAALEEARDRAEAADEEREKLAPFEPLVEKLTGLETTYEGLLDRRDEADEKAERVETLAEQLEDRDDVVEIYYT